MTARPGRVLRRLARAAGAAAVVAVALGWPAPAAAEEGARPYGQGRLFELSRAGAEPSHVFGTFHVGDPDVVSVPASLAGILARSRRVLLEVRPGRAAAEAQMRAMILPEGRSLEDVVGAALYRRIEEAARPYDIPAAHRDRLRPWAVAKLISVPPAVAPWAVNGDPVLDATIARFAVQNGIPVDGLEGPREHMAVFADLEHDAEIALVEAALEMNHQLDAVYAEMKAAYRAGDLDALHAMSPYAPDAADEAKRRFYRRLIDARNALMAERMVPHLERGRAFVAVGALHLSGEAGILRLLEQRGYAIRRVF